MRKKVVIESKKLDELNNEILKNIYDKALDIRVRYITKQNEEKELIKNETIFKEILKIVWKVFKRLKMLLVR